MDKELKKMNRQELLELLLEAVRRNNELQIENERLRTMLQDRTMMIDSAGSLAEAALRLNDVFKAADEAAKLYVENVEYLQKRWIEKNQAADLCGVQKDETESI